MNRGLRSDQIENWVMEGLKTALDDPEIVAEYIRHLHAVVTSLNGERAAGAEAETRKAKDIDRKRMNLMAAVEDGRASELVMVRLAELQREKAMARLNDAPSARTAIPIKMIPDAAHGFRRQLSEIRGFLALESGRGTNARERVRSMIARIGAKRTETGLWIEVDGDLGAILNFTDRPESWSTDGCGSQKPQRVDDFLFHLSALFEPSYARRNCI